MRTLDPVELTLCATGAVRADERLLTRLLEVDDDLRDPVAGFLGDAPTLLAGQQGAILRPTRLEKVERKEPADGVVIEGDDL